MTSHTAKISQELLSAYIDGEVNSQEQRLIEMALAADPEIVWEVESLRHTVALLGDLPAIALPQSFVLPEARVADVVATRRAAHRQKTSQTASSWGGRWQSLLGFLGGGNLILRNAAGVAVVAFFVLLAGDVFIGAPTLPAPQTLSQPMPAAAPAIAQADVQAGAAEATAEMIPEMAVEVAAVAEEGGEVTAQEMPVAKAMPASQDAEPAAAPAAISSAADAAQPSQESAALIPDEAPMTLGTDPRAGAGGEVGGGGEGLGAGGGGEIAGPQPPVQPQAAPAPLVQSAPPAADIQRIAPTPAETESVNQDNQVSAASLRITEMLTTPAEAMMASVAVTATESATDPVAEIAAEPVATVPASQAVAMSESAADPGAEPGAELAPAEALAPADELPAVAKSAPAPQPAKGPFAPLRLAQLGLALLALLLSGLWVRSR